MSQPTQTTATKTYLCRYIDPTPPGAGGWLLSEFMKDPANREARFEDYEQASAERLFADVTVQREVSPDQARRAAYQQNTAFAMAYDAAGWHLFILCGEPALADLLADGANAGSLELYITRGGAGGGYSQWIVSLPDGQCSTIEWNSPHRRFRPLKSYLKTQTVTHDQQIAVHSFIPWEALYDDLPLTGGTWPMGLIRWTPAGGITWGGKVHEIGRWGQIQWQPPTPQQALAIKTNLLRKAWSRYQKTRDALAAHWGDPIVGDPAFHEARVRPVTDRLTAAGDAVKDLSGPSAAAVVETLWPYLPQWMEFNYTVDELRHAYLAERLT